MEAGEWQAGEGQGVGVGGWGEAERGPQMSTGASLRWSRQPPDALGEPGPYAERRRPMRACFLALPSAGPCDFSMAAR